MVRRSGLSATQIKIVEYFEQNEKRNIDLNEISKLVYQNRARPKNWRNSLCGMMREIILDSKTNKYRIIRSSPLGRSKEAQYFCSSAKVKFTSKQLEDVTL